VQFYKHHGIVG